MWFVVKNLSFPKKIPNSKTVNNQQINKKKSEKKSVLSATTSDLVSGTTTGFSSGVSTGSGANSGSTFGTSVAIIIMESGECLYNYGRSILNYAGRPKYIHIHKANQHFFLILTDFVKHRWCSLI